MKAAVQAPPRAVGIELADWNWKVVREFVEEHFKQALSRSSCLNYLHRLGFVLKRPKKRLLKADEEKRRGKLWNFVEMSEYEIVDRQGRK